MANFRTLSPLTGSLVGNSGEVNLPKLPGMTFRDPRVRGTRICCWGMRKTLIDGIISACHGSRTEFQENSSVGRSLRTPAMRLAQILWH
jgi:hypothetical protein